MTAPGQMFETERAIVNGIEMTVWKNAPSTLRQMLDLVARARDADFLVYEDQRYTFDEHYAIASTLAHRLIADGVTKGDRVAIASRNLPQWVIAFWAHGVHWRRRHAHQRVVDDRGAAVRTARLGIVAALRRRGATRARRVGLSTTWRNCRRSSSSARIPHRPARGAAATIASASSTSRSSSARSSRDGAAGRRARDRRRRDDVLYLGHDGTPKGAVGIAPQRHLEPHEPLIRRLPSERYALGAGDPAVRRERPSAGLLNVPFFHATGCFAVMMPRRSPAARSS